MSVNTLFIIVAAALAAGAAWGWKKGLIEGIVRIVSSILGIFVLVVVTQGIYRYIKGSMVSIAITILILVIIGFIHRFVKFITNTLKLVRALPVGKSADRLFGAAFGAAEVLCIVWVVFILIGSFDFFGLKQWLLEQVAQSQFLQIIYNTNYLALLMQKLLQQLL